MAERVTLARISGQALTLDECVRLVESPAAGAVVTFTGVVRDHDDGRSVVELEYEGHPSAEDRLAAVARAVAEAHPAVSIAVEHRVGRLSVGDLALVAAVSSAHRSDAFAACAQLIDDIKREVPIWKNQRFSDGSSEWVGSLG